MISSEIFARPNEGGKASGIPEGKAHGEGRVGVIWECGIESECSRRRVDLVGLRARQSVDGHYIQ